MLDRSLKRLGKKSRRGFRGYPLATMAAYGPDDRRASKLVVTIFAREGEESEMRKWSSDTADPRSDRDTLARLNRELGANFQPEQFSHRALWNHTHSRIEMHLKSLTPQQVIIPANSAGGDGLLRVLGIHELFELFRGQALPSPGNARNHACGCGMSPEPAQ